MMKRSVAIFATVLLLPLVCCVESFPLDRVGSGEKRLVVDALLTTDTTSHCVRLTTTVPYGTKQKDVPVVEGARVRLSDGNGTVELTETPGTGCYYTPDDYYGVTGRTYTLEIDAEIDGEEWKVSGSDIMPEQGIRADKMDYYRISDSLWMFAIWGQDLPGLLSHYAADLYVEGEHYPFKSWFVIDGAEYFDGNYLACGEYVPYASSSMLPGPSKPLETGDVVTIHWYSMSDFLHSYFLGLLNECTPRTPMISAQPANLPTNMSGNALGYFATANLAKATVIIGDPDRTRMQMLQDNNMIPFPMK